MSIFRMNEWEFHFTKPLNRFYKENDIPTNPEHDIPCYRYWLEAWIMEGNKVYICYRALTINSQKFDNMRNANLWQHSSSFISTLWQWNRLSLVLAFSLNPKIKFYYIYSLFEQTHQLHFWMAEEEQVKGSNPHKHSGEWEKLRKRNKKKRERACCHLDMALRMLIAEA